MLVDSDWVTVITALAVHQVFRKIDTLCDITGTHPGPDPPSCITSYLDLAAIDNGPATPVNAGVDKLVRSADTDGYATTFIVAPSIIYGHPSGPLFEGPAPIAAPLTGVVRIFAHVAAGKGRPGIIGKGANAWGYVHMEDDTNAYYRLFDAALFGTTLVSHGREGYFFVKGSEHTTHEVVRALGEALVELGVTRGEEPAALAVDEQVKYFEFFAEWLFANTRCKAERLRKEVGWVRNHTTHEEFTRDIKADAGVAAKALKA
ncbi:hypothetical protein BD311DRAFT_869921 [Dichomitus squalens]|uniref:NAD(P)-binding protein n=1 Tax=Dichomitus squalens TaxID=114155 RepID=A0A4Q9M5W5_9APHY|nr:hypothetical protein BD311DRAFT_869921 [Dichomitus squalens]